MRRETGEPAILDGVEHTRLKPNRAEDIAEALDEMTSTFYYRLALAISLIVNVLLITWISYFDTIEGVVSIVETAVGIVN